MVPNDSCAWGHRRYVVGKENERKEEKIIMKAFGIACAVLLGVIVLAGALWIIADRKEGKK